MTTRPLTEHQFCTLEVLAQDPARNRLVWPGCGVGSFGCGKDPADRMGCQALIRSVPAKYRWPRTSTILSLERKGLVTEIRRTPYFFFHVFKITRRGLDAFRDDPAHDAEMHAR